MGNFQKIDTNALDYMRSTMRIAKLKLDELDSDAVNQAETDWSIELSSRYSNFEFWAHFKPEASADYMAAMMIINWVKCAAYAFGEEVLVGVW